MVKKKQPARWFQWIDGENAGKVVELVDIDTESGDTFYYFSDGESCNKEFVAANTCKPKDLVNKFMVEVESPKPAHIWGFRTVETERREVGDKEFIQAPPIDDIVNLGNKNHETGDYELKDSQVGRRKLTPPTGFSADAIRQLPSFDWFYSEGGSKEEIAEMEAPSVAPVQQSHVNETPVQELVELTPVKQVVQQPIAQQKVEMTPDEQAISILVNKAKKHDTEIVLTVHMDLPSKSIYSIAKEEFDNGEELFIKEVVKSLSNDEIVRAIGDGLKAAYEN